MLIARLLGFAIVTGALLGASPSLTASRPLTIVPYRPDGTAGKLIAVPVSLNGAAPEWFCLDSGAPHSIIDVRLADKLGLTAVNTGQIAGTGHGSVAAGHPGPQTLRIGAVSLRVTDPMIVALKDVPINGQDRGLIGSELFEHYVVRIDGAKRTLTLYDPANFRPDGHGAALPLSTDGSRLYVEVTLWVRPGLKVTHKLRIDTGSEDSVNDPAVKLARVVRKTRLGNGLGADYEGYSGIFDAIQIGPYRIRNVWGPGGDLPAIGMEILRRFVVTFDVPHRRLYLRPTKALYSPVPSPGQG